LLRAAEEAGFDVLRSTDKNIQYQQNLKGVGRDAAEAACTGLS
jgi:hypothetical protein